MQLISPGVLSVFLHDVFQDHYGKHQRPGFELSQVLALWYTADYSCGFPKTDESCSGYPNYNPFSFMSTLSVHGVCGDGILSLHDLV